MPGSGEVERLQIAIETSAGDAVKGIDAIISSLNGLKSASGTSFIKTLSNDFKALKSSITGIDSKIESLRSLADVLKDIGNAAGAASLSGVSSELGDIKKAMSETKKIQEGDTSKVAQASADGMKKTAEEAATASENIMNAQTATDGLGRSIDVISSKKIAPEVKELINDTQRAHSEFQQLSGVLGNLSGLLGGAFSQPIQQLKQFTNTASQLDKITAVPKLQQQLSEVNAQIQQTEAQLKNVESAMRSAYDIGDVEEFSRLSQIQSDVHKNFETLNKDQDILKQALQTLGASGSSSIGSIGSAAMASRAGVGALTNSALALDAALAPLTVVIVALTAAFNILKATANKLKEIFDSVVAVLRKIATAIGNAVQSFGKWAASVKDAAKETLGLNKSGNALENTIKKLQKVWTKLWNVFQIKVIRTVLNSLFSGVSDGLGELAKEFGDFNAVMSQGASTVLKFKNTIAASLAPAIAGLMPIITAVLNAFIKLFEVIGAFFSLLFGTPFYKAKDAAVDYAGSLDDIGGAAKKAAKEMNQLPFDELNTAMQDNAGGGGGGGGINDWFEQSPIPDWIADLFAADPYELGYKVGQWIISGLESIDWDSIQAKAADIGRYLGQLINGFVDSFLDSEDPGIIGRSIAELINTGLILVYSFIDTVNFENLGTFIGANIQGAIENFQWARLGQTIGMGINAAINTVLNSLREINFFELGQSIGDVFVEAIKTIQWDRLGDLLIEGFKSALETWKGLLAKLEGLNIGEELGILFARFIKETPWDTVAENISDSLIWAIGQAADFIAQIDGKEIVNAIKTFLNSLKWQEIKEELSRLWDEVWRVLSEVALEGFGIDLDEVVSKIKTLGKIALRVFKTIAVGITSLLVSPIAALALALVFDWGAITDGWNSFKETVSGVTDKISDVWESVKTGAGDALTTVGGFFADVAMSSATGWDSFKENAGIAWDSVGDFADKAVEKVREVWGTITDWFNEKVGEPIRDVFSEMWQKISEFTEEAWEKIKDVFSVAYEWFTTTVVDPIRNKFEEAWEKIREFTSNLWTNIKEIFNPALEWFNDTVITPIRDKFDAAWEKIGEFASNTWTNIKGVWDKAKSWFEENVTNPISNAFKAMVNGIATFFENMANGVIGIFEQLVNWVIKAINSISFDLPDILGGAHIGFNLSEISLGRVSIPKFKQGSDFIASENTLAMVDYGEAILTQPENRVYRAAGGTEGILGLMNGSSTGSNQTLTVEDMAAAFSSALQENAGIFQPVLQIGDDEIGRSADRYTQSRGATISGGLNSYR